jgi:exodeoxyribonuclease V alpha subunit
MEYISGVVERITYENEENGFCVIKIKSKGYSDLVTVVGSLGAVNVGAVIHAKGEWKVDSKFGRQFAALDYRETVPATITGIEKYLGSGLIKGIGPAFAKRIVKCFKEDTLRVLDEQADSLIDVEGIGKKRVEMIKKAWQDQKEIKNVMLFLQSNGVSTAYAIKIFKKYGNESIEIVKANPFKLADDIWGIGFKTADKIAMKMGFDKNSYERCRAGIVYVLNELSNSGHCFATREQLLDETEKMLELEQTLIDSTLLKMFEEGTVIKDCAINDEQESIFLPTFYHSEVGTAKRIKEIISVKSLYHAADVNTIINSIEKEENISYDVIQKEAIQRAAASKFMVLTGGPGTGKTTTTLAIIKVFQKIQASVLLAAPTGRAAKRMSEATGMEAKTIHRLLEFKPNEGYQKNNENKLECDVLIIDETSMVDIVLMYNLMKAVADETIVILAGDVNQLPSVGAGNVLNDIIASGIVNVVKLTRIFRQAQGSAIITNAHKINNGDFPDLRGGRSSDFFFIEEDDPGRVVQTIKDLCTRRLPGFYKVDPVKDIQVLCPMQRGDTGAQNLNTVLQAALNKSEISTKYGGTVYKNGDKVMQIKNNYDKNVFNGDIGSVMKIDNDDKMVIIDFDGNYVEYDITELDEVVLAYATTVHKSQGSEYKIVVAPFTMQHYMMLQRNLLYTCVTRAKKIMVLVGTIKSVAMAVRNNKTINRNTRLAERLREKMAEPLADKNY